MNKLLTLLFISISVASFGQTLAKVDKTAAPIKETKPALIDSALSLPIWHQQQIAYYDAEIKRLGATTIEAEQQRIANEKQILINSFIVGRVVDPSRIEKIQPPSDGKILLILKPLKK